MYAFLPGFGVGVMAITMIPSLLALILVRLISNDNTYYKPFSKDEIKQTLFEIIGIAVLGPVALFAAFIIIGILGPFALFLGIPIIIGLYALPLMLFWDMEFVIASFWGLVLLILQISIAVLL
tara:strand:+ start:265 stop:633 length:369 start_codon:yes stop_codon:yes gene_type:complete